MRPFPLNTRSLNKKGPTPEVQANSWPGTALSWTASRKPGARARRDTNAAMPGKNPCSHCWRTVLSPGRHPLRNTSGQILRFPIKGAVGLGAPISIPGPANSIGLAVGTPSGGSIFQIFVYVSDPMNNVIDGFSKSRADGSLSALAGSPFPMGTASGGPASLTVFGNILYAASTDSSIVAFRHRRAHWLADDSLRFALCGGRDAAANPSVPFGKRAKHDVLFAADFADASGSISGDSLSQSGVLTPVPGSPFPTLSGSCRRACSRPAPSWMWHSSMPKRNRGLLRQLDGRALADSGLAVSGRTRNFLACGRQRLSLLFRNTRITPFQFSRLTR